MSCLCGATYWSPRAFSELVNQPVFSAEWERPSKPSSVQATTSNTPMHTPLLPVWAFYREWKCCSPKPFVCWSVIIFMLFIQACVTSWNSQIKFHIFSGLLNVRSLTLRKATKMLQLCLLSHSLAMFYKIVNYLHWVKFWFVMVPNKNYDMYMYPKHDQAFPI